MSIYLNPPGITTGDCCVYTVEAKIASFKWRKDLKSHDPVSPNGQYGETTDNRNVVSLPYFILNAS